MMELNDFLKNLTWKKIIVIVVALFLMMTIVREILFMSFINQFQQVFSQFNSQFDRDQKAIQDRIADSQREMKQWQESFDKKSEHFSKQADRDMDEGMAYMNEANKKFDAEHPDQNPYINQSVENKAADSKEKIVWEEGRKQYHDKTGQWLPSYEKVFDKNKNETTKE